MYVRSLYFGLNFWYLNVRVHHNFGIGNDHPVAPPVFTILGNEARCLYQCPSLYTTWWHKSYRCKAHLPAIVWYDRVSGVWVGDIDYTGVGGRVRCHNSSGTSVIVNRSFGQLYVFGRSIYKHTACTVISTLKHQSLRWYSNSTN